MAVPLVLQSQEWKDSYRNEMIRKKTIDQKPTGGLPMFAYLCRRCGACGSEFILEQMEDPGSGRGGSGSSEKSLENTCPSCRSLFVPESYFVLQSAEPLMQGVSTVLDIGR